MFWSRRTIPDPIRKRENKLKRLICFGDSITAGWDGHQETRRLTDRLSEGLGWIVTNAGVPGENTEQALTRMNKDVLECPFDRITIFFGANDSSLHKGIPLKQFKTNLIFMARAVSPQKAIFITPSPIVDKKQKGKRMNERVSLYAEAVLNAAKETGVPLIDLHSEMLRLPDYQGMLLHDGLHFTNMGYDFLATEIIRQVKKSEEH